MERSKVDIAYDHVTGIDRNYPDWASTFGCCANNECNNSARGCGYCANCHEIKLATIVGGEIAGKYHAAVKAKSKAYGHVYDAADSVDT